MLREVGGNPYNMDCGTNFECKLIRRICQKLEIKKTSTVPYNPKSDGQVERLNKTISEMLSTYVDENQLDWDAHLSFVMMAHHARLQESTGFTPNKLMFGRENLTPLSVLKEPRVGQHFLSITD